MTGSGYPWVLRRLRYRPVVRPAEWLGFFWTLPNTLLGLLLSMHRTAMTVGFVIVAAVPVEGRLLVHERHHIRQYMAWGPFFIPVYLLLAIPFGYRRHPMERAARRAAGEDT